MATGDAIIRINGKTGKFMGEFANGFGRPYYFAFSPHPVQSGIKEQENRQPKTQER